MKPIWTPLSSQLEETQIFQFKSKIEKKYSVELKDYESFWSWSVRNIPTFWSEWIAEIGILFQKKGKSIWNRKEHFSETEWFPGFEINFAENLLRKFDQDLDRVAIHFQPESETSSPIHLTRHEVVQKVFLLQKHLIEIGFIKGDRLAAVLPNSHTSILGMLATTSLGGIWSSASPDFGVKGILDRFQQIEPKVLLVADGYFFKGKAINCTDKWIEILSALPSVETIVVWNFLDPKNSSSFDILKSWCEIKNKKCLSYDAILSKDLASTDKSVQLDDIQFTPITFQDPVYIMYSSGTTGLPKCIVQGAGVLINHTKELILHTDLREYESISYYTTCGWMMWNWVASSLFVGSKLCIYDGNPFYPDWKFLWQWISKEKISVFGTSAKYLAVLETETSNLKENSDDSTFSPFANIDLSNLRCILSTGSPLLSSGFEFVYSKIKKDVLLCSISGGTDLNGCFALGNPMLPVYPGELQSRGLAMAVSIFDDEGGRILCEKGELVCEEPFPSMPLYFWNDSLGEKYKDAYFSKFHDIWCHGDFAEITQNNGIIIYGRSDATLNPGGVRIGTSDIYTIIETFPEIQDSVIIGQDYENDVRIVLFVKMNYQYELNEELILKIKSNIKNQVSPRHVPSLIFAVKDIPYTVNGKKVELAVKNIMEGKAVKNSNALANPECLEEYKNFT